jgi:hypothetical protein
MAALALGCTQPVPGLPSMGSRALCGEPVPEPLGTCAWIRDATSLVTGTVRALSWRTDAPLREVGENFELAADCERIQPAFVIELDDVETIAGAQQPSELVLTYGRRTLDFWRTPPVPELDGTTVWGGRKTERIVVGQPLGAVVHDVESMLTSSFEPFFLVDDHGVITWSETESECGMEAPPARPKSVKELQSSEKNCDPGTADTASRRAARTASLANPHGTPCCAATCIR